MRWPRARFTVRRTMVLVALAALAFAVEALRRRYEWCQVQAARWALVEQSHLGMAHHHEKVAALYRKFVTEGSGSARYNNEEARFFAGAAARERAEARRAVDRGRDYRLAAVYPWLAIPQGDPAPSVAIQPKRESD